MRTSSDVMRSTVCRGTPRGLTAKSGMPRALASRFFVGGRSVSSRNSLILGVVIDFLLFFAISCLIGIGIVALFSGGK